MVQALAPIQLSIFGGPDPTAPAYSAWRAEGCSAKGDVWELSGTTSTDSVHAALRDMAAELLQMAHRAPKYIPTMSWSVWLRYRGRWQTRLQVRLLCPLGSRPWRVATLGRGPIYCLSEFGEVIERRV